MYVMNFWLILYINYASLKYIIKLARYILYLRTFILIPLSSIANQ